MTPARFHTSVGGAVRQPQNAPINSPSVDLDTLEE